MRIIYGVKDFFNFNRSEQRGITILLVILIGMVLILRFVPFTKQVDPENFAVFEKELLAFEEAVRQAEEQEYLASQKKSGKRQFTPFKHPDSLYRPKPIESGNLMIELNSADTSELMLLYGIGPSYARRMVGYRERLGGYADVSQLLQVYGMDSDRFNRIRKHVQVDTGLIRKINLNSVEFKELLRHPYFSYELTREVFTFKRKVKSFTSLDELKQIDGINDSLYRLITPYVTLIQDSL